MRSNLARHAPGLTFDQVLLERMASPPLAELIVGIKRETGFGLALVIGAGGILVELLKDSRSLLLPTTDQAIHDALLSLRCAPLLTGFRGGRRWICRRWSRRFVRWRITPARTPSGCWSWT